MNILELIEELEFLPRDKILYDSINQPTWHIATDGQIVLAGSPCPVQTAEQLIHKLKLVQKKDLPSQDNTFKRTVFDDTEIYCASVREINGLYKLNTEIVNNNTIKLWQMLSTDHMTVDVVIGGPSYVMSSDKVKILVHKHYYNTLGINGKRLYLEELLSVHSFTWQDSAGNIHYMNKEYWDNSRKENNCKEEPTISVSNNILSGFNSVKNSHINEKECKSF